MPLAGFEPTIPVLKRAKAFHVLDRAAIGMTIIVEIKQLEINVCLLKPVDV
jgi:hypothetical protein